jgi:hypothetical protein
MKKFMATATFLFLATNAYAETSINTTVQGIRTGWGGDYFAVVSPDAIQNPAHCPSPDGYVSESSHPGYNTYYAAALTAFSINSKVTVVIDNTQCSLSRPKIIGINLYK